MKKGELTYCFLTYLVCHLPRKTLLKILEKENCKVFEFMIYRLGLTIEDFFETLDIKYQESNTQNWMIPERTNEISELPEALSHFITIEVDKTTRKKTRTIYAEKHNLKVKFDNNSFFKTLYVFLFIRKKILLRLKN